MILVIFGRFSTILDIFDLCISKFVFKTSILLQPEFLEARFWIPNSIFYSEHSTRISNVRPEIQTLDRKFQRSAGNSNVRPEIRTFDQKFERSTRNSTVRPEIGTFGRDLERSGPHGPGPTWSKTYLGSKLI